MALRDTLKKGKLLMTGAALGGALLMGENAQAHPCEVKDTKAKTEQRSEGKSEMRQKIAYLDEYVAAVESGKNKEEAYKEFSLKMADGNAKKMAEMQQQIEKLQKTTSAESWFNFGGNLAIILMGIGLYVGLDKRLNKQKAQISSLTEMKNKKVKDY